MQRIASKSYSVLSVLRRRLQWYLIGPNAMVSSHKSGGSMLTLPTQRRDRQTLEVKIDLANFTLQLKRWRIRLCHSGFTGCHRSITSRIVAISSVTSSPMFGPQRTDRSDYYYLESVPRLCIRTTPELFHGFIGQSN
jgi:hypothetical protein